MKKILKLFLYIFVFILALFILLPKNELYNFAQEQLEKNKVIISNEQVEEKLFALNINNSDIYFEGINISKVQSISLNTYFYETNIDVKNVYLLDSLKSMFPSKINFINLKYSIFEFDKVLISSNGEFGDVNGVVDLLNKKITISLKASSKMKRSYTNILKQMKKQGGEYIYEYRF